MTPKGPRYSAGAVGLGSHVSKWLGAPQRKTNTTDLARAVAAARAGSTELPRPNASGSDEPNRKNERRETPLHVRA